MLDNACRAIRVARGNCSCRRIGREEEPAFSVLGGRRDWHISRTLHHACMTIRVTRRSHHSASSRALNGDCLTMTRERDIVHWTLEESNLSFVHLS
jgi:hypothetical protein